MNYLEALVTKLHAYLKLCILCAVFLLSTQFCFAQNEIISVDFSNEKIEDILIELAAEHAYEIVFNSSYFNEQRLSIQLENKPLIRVLEQVLANTQVDISIKNKSIKLTKWRKLYGYISDKDSGETLINATIYDPQSGIGSITNELGYFYIEIPYEHQQLIPSYVGYEQAAFLIREQTKLPLHIKMKSNASFDPIIVSKSEQTKAVERTLGKNNLITNDIKTLSATGGETDAFQYLYTQAGIATGPDGLGGVHVRGADVGHNLFLYEGVKVYAPFHSLGLFSIFDINVLKQAEFSKHSFHPKHGGRLASVLDMKVKEGDLQQWNSELSFSTLASHIGINGPLVKDKTSIAVYARRTHLDPLFKNISRKRKKENLETGYTNHYFYDINAKIQHQASKNDKFSLSLYAGKDSYINETNFYDIDEVAITSDSSLYDLKWQNQLVALKWHHFYNNKLYSNLTLSSSKHKYQNIYKAQIYDQTFGIEEYQQSNLLHFFSSINDLGADIDFGAFPNPKHHLSFGAGFHYNTYRPGVGQESVNSSLNELDQISNDYFDEHLDNNYTSNELHFYVNDKWQLHQKLILQLGARLAIFKAYNQLFDISSSHPTLQANLSLSWLISKKLTSTLSFDKTAQTVHLLSTANTGFPNDLWIPSIENLKPATAKQINLGLDYRLNTQWQLSADLYYKELDNLLKFHELSSTPSLFNLPTNFWESQVSLGSGTSQGLEFSINYQNHSFKASVNYTLSKADRTFKDFKTTPHFPFAFDQRHKLSINTYQKITKNLWCFANWSFYNGINQTLYKSDGPFVPLESYFPPPDVRLSTINAYQLPNYHRLDIGLLWQKAFPKVAHECQVGLQNVYNRKNVFFSYYEDDFLFPEESGIRDSRTLPLLPSVMYKLSF